MATQNQSSGSPSTGATVPLDGGKRRYIIASRRGMAPATAGIRPMSAAHLRGLVKSIPGIEVERVIQPHRVPATFAVGADEATDLYVVKLAEDQAEMLRQSAPPNLIVEEDAPLGFGEPAAAVKEPPETVTWKAPSGIKPRTIRFKVLGDAERPLKDATVTLCGEGIPVQGRTDAKGELSLELYAFPGDRPKSVFVSAECNHWSRFLPDPELSESGINTIRLASLEESIKGFPEQYSYGWGAQLMGLDRLDRRLTGKGVKIAIIDSGADNRHPLLKHVQKGVDLANGQDPVTWCEDHIGHGTHCAGTICADRVGLVPARLRAGCRGPHHQGLPGRTV